MFEELVYKVYLLSFGAMIFMAVGGGIMAVTNKNIIYCFFGLVVALLGVSGLYYTLGSPLVSVMQVMIYIGAVCVAIAFGISLTRKEGDEGIKPPGIKVAIPVVLVLMMLGAVLKGLAGRAILGTAQKVDESPLGHLLLKEYLLPFEILSILLTIAVIGAVTIALIKRREEEE